MIESNYFRKIMSGIIVPQHKIKNNGNIFFDTRLIKTKILRKQVLFPEQKQVQKN